MNIHTRHIELVEAAGLRVPLCDADDHYLNQGIARPMCCGVWLDWKPADLIHNGVGIADLYAPGEFEKELNQTTV